MSKNQKQKKKEKKHSQTDQILDVSSVQGFILFAIWHINRKNFDKTKKRWGGRGKEEIVSKTH